jgi:phosphoribosylformylglycinamidine synthase subunit PurL
MLGRRFRGTGDVILLLGEGAGELGGSEYLRQIHGRVAGIPPALDLERERALQQLVVALASERLIRSAHDCSDGGLAVTLAECCFETGGIGAEASVERTPVTGDETITSAAALFGESASRVVVSVTTEDVSAVLERAADADVPARVIGQTGGNLLRLAVGGQVVIDLAVDEAERIWSTTIEAAYEKRVA